MIYVNVSRMQFSTNKIKKQIFILIYILLQKKLSRDREKKKEREREREREREERERELDIVCKFACVLIGFCVDADKCVDRRHKLDFGVCLSKMSFIVVAVCLLEWRWSLPNNFISPIECAPRRCPAYCVIEIIWVHSLYVSCREFRAMNAD